MNLFLLLLFCGNMGTPQPPAHSGEAPAFRNYPATSVLHGKLAAPRLIRPEERRFRTELRQAIAKGYGVVDGGTELERPGSNFAGHYVLVQWGCGINCMKAALIDGTDGAVLRLPQMHGEALDYFQLPTGSVDLRTLEFRRNSRLLGVARIADGMTYYYVLEGRRWRYLRREKTPDVHD